MGEKIDRPKDLDAWVVREKLGQRLLRAIFRPTRVAGIPDELELPDGFEDEIRTEVLVRVGWNDLFALFFSRWICISTCTATENKPGALLNRATGIQFAICEREMRGEDS